MIYRDCKNRKEFEKWIFETFSLHYGLKCTCHTGVEIEFFNAASHYQRCEYWKFCHAVTRTLDWTENEQRVKIMNKESKL